MNRENENFINIINNEQRGMYLHIPFCKYICTYCDFCKKYSKDHDHVQYIKALVREIDYKVKNNHNFSKGKLNLRTIYIGGGTPSALSKEALILLMEYLNEIINVSNLLEFTIECNPDDVTEELMEIYKQYGVNRISMGVQTLNNEILKVIRRGHTKEDTINALNIASEYFDNISIDLMFNLPKQTLSDINDAFLFIKDYQDKITHISYYSLIIEEHTVIGSKEFENFSEDEEAEIYKLIQEQLQEIGFEQYEISNFSKKGKESIHNISYWFNIEYFGCGLGASQYLNNKRETNTRSMKKYLLDIENNDFNGIIVDEELIDEIERKKERIIFGLRTVWGIEDNLINIKDINKEIKSFLKFENNKIAIKPEYFFIDNDIVLEMLDRIK